MVIYVRLEPKEANDSRRKILDVKEHVRKIQDKAISFNAIRSEKKKSSLGIITRTRALEQEIMKLRTLLPKLETVKAKEKLLGTKESKVREVKLEPKPKRPMQPTGAKGKRTYEEELEEIRKKITELK